MQVEKGGLNLEPLDVYLLMYFREVCAMYRNIGKS